MPVLHVTSRFRRAYKKLPGKIKQDFNNKVAIFSESPFQVSLGTHKLKGSLGNSHAFCLRDGWRVLVDFVGDGVVLLVNVGDHDDYKKWERN